MPQANSTAIGLVRAIDAFTDKVGIVVSWLAIPLVGGVAYEVISRYVFNKPTIWAFDATFMLYGALFMLGSAFALLKGAHIRTDFFWEKFSIRKKGWIDTVSYVVFFFPSLLILLWISGHEALYSYNIGEVSDQSPWRPILWPFKSVIPITCALLMIQGVSELIKSLHMARTGEELDHKEKIEV